VAARPPAGRPAGFADSRWIIGDLGCGTGQVSAALAPFVERVVAVDASAAMLQAARKRLHGLDNIDLRRGELEALPIDIDEERLDAATLMLVLHHVAEPEKALTEVARVLKPAGRVLIVDMLPHDRDSYRQQMGHVWLGFAEEQTRRMMTAAGFEGVRVVPLPPDGRAKGPALFVATGQRHKQPHEHEVTKTNRENTKTP
jgi:ArsR family transcriptional regulator